MNCVKNHILLMHVSAEVCSYAHFTMSHALNNFHWLMLLFAPFTDTSLSMAVLIVQVIRHTEELSSSGKFVGEFVPPSSYISCQLLEYLSRRNAALAQLEIKVLASTAWPCHKPLPSVCLSLCITIINTVCESSLLCARYSAVNYVVFMESWCKWQPQLQ